ncbi:MAG: TIM-barrel domain-containing protein, partial [Planctomycetota bacterium]
LMQNMLGNDLFRKSNRRTYGLVRASNGAAAAHPFVIYSDSYGHQQYITGLGSASLSGVLWCPEIRSARNSREWLNRMHTVCFSPMAMLNAWASGQKPWSFSEVTDRVRETIELRMRLLPYLYTAFHKYHTEGIPPVRSLLMEPGATNDDTAFMFGPDILVAPFFESNATKRIIQLPEGNWYDFYTGRLVGNGTRVTLRSEELQDRAPLLVKEGAVIPMLARPVSNSEQAFGCPLEIRHYGRSPGSCVVYEDDGKTFEFESGKSRLRQFQVNSDGEVKESLIKNDAKPMFGAVEEFRRMSQ